MMKQNSPLNVVIMSLALFSVLFGAGNIIFPLQIGAIAGNAAPLAILGFLISGILLPLLGLVGASLYDGDYLSFFHRLGKIPGDILIFICMLALGPAIALPRVVTLAHEMLAPIFPNIPLYAFSGMFLALTFVLGMNKKDLIRIIGAALAPLVLAFAVLFIAIGFTSLHPPANQVLPSKPLLQILQDSIALGYHTLDLIAALFFASFFLNLLIANTNATTKEDFKKIESLGIRSSYIGITILALITIGFCILGVWYANDLGTIPFEQYLTAVMTKLFGTQSVWLTTATVLLACLSSSIGLSAVVAEYIHKHLVPRINYSTSLALVLALTFIPSNFGLQTILTHSEPIINLTYPAIITLVVCNILNKLFGFSHVRLPVFIVFATVLMHYIHRITGC